MDLKLYIGHNLLTTEDFISCCSEQKTVIIADQIIQELYGDKVAEQISAEFLTLPSGEGSKSLEMVAHLVDTLCKMGCDRTTVLIALGGGVVSDLVGFVASIYMRGIPFVLIPTTLLAMVDAAVGGKTGVNTPYGKNLMGTFAHPKAIFIDLEYLKTLSEKEKLNGFAEIFKLGLIYDPALWEMAKRGGVPNETLVLQAIRGKMEIVEQDPKEKGLRRILNFGHTIGHALEKVSQYTMSHGEAVALGCLVEAHLSRQLGYLEAQEFEKIQQGYSLFSLQLPQNYQREKLLQAMKQDKKRVAAAVRFVLIDRIGHAISFGENYCREVVFEELRASLDYLETY